MNLSLDSVFIRARAGGPALARARALLAVTKPRIIELLLITTVPSMVLAAQGWPGTALVVATVLGGALCAGGANALNCYLDRDIDAVMSRTAARPLVTGVLRPATVALFGVALGLAGAILLAVRVNLLTAAITAGALLYYVVIYTILLKRRTPQNIVIGGAAGAAPVLAGWSAVTGTVGLEAWLMFGLIFLWTPPHFWALAIAQRDDYASAHVPMLPVTAGIEQTAKTSFWYSVALLPTSLGLGLAAGLSPIFLVGATVLGLRFVVATRRLSADRAVARRVFGISISYLAAVFGLIAVDVALF